MQGNLVGEWLESCDVEESRQSRGLRSDFYSQRGSGLIGPELPTKLTRRLQVFSISECIGHW